MSNIKDLVECLNNLEDLNYPILIETELDACWYMQDDEVFWNTEDNLEDLYYQDGETYGGHLPKGHTTVGDYFIFNFDTSFGTNMTMILSKRREYKLDSLEEMFDD